VLAMYGKSASSLAPELRGLNAAQLKEYLEATKGGLAGHLAQIWPAWRRKMAADPKFAFKLLMEETVGLGLALSGMIAARGKEILNELDYAFGDMIVGAVLNFTALWIAAPSVIAGQQSTSTFSKLLGRLPPNIFAATPPGIQYSVAMRIAGGLVTGTKFALVGLAAGFVGTCISSLLLSLRNMRHGSVPTASAKKTPGILENSLGWSGFMFVSSSPRYQAVAGLERVTYRFMPDAVAKTSSGLFRTMNNIIGGATWVYWAKFIKLQ